MGNQNVNLSALDRPDTDVWDRVRSLSSSGTPVTGRLFAPTDETRVVEPALMFPPSPIPGAAGQPTQVLAPQPLAQPSNSVSDARPDEVDLVIPAQAKANVISTPAQSWASLRVATATTSKSGKTHMISRGAARNDPVARSVDPLRIRLLQSLKDNGWKRVAIASPTPGCGATFMACNLAVSMSRLRLNRTVLFDFNMRAAGVADTLGVQPHGDMGRFLMGEADATSHMVRYADNVALAVSDQQDAAPAELLYDNRTAETLDQVQSALQPDVMLFDMPPVLAYDDLAAFLPQVDGVLLVTDGTQNTAKQISECERVISSRSTLLGVVLNRSRDSDSTKFGYSNA